MRTETTASLKDALKELTQPKGVIGLAKKHQLATDGLGDATVDELGFPADLKATKK